MSTKCYMAFSALSAGATVITFFLIYWFCGGVLALSFLMMSIVGECTDSTGGVRGLCPPPVPLLCGGLKYKIAIWVLMDSRKK